MNGIKKFVDEHGKTLGYIDERSDRSFFAFKAYAVGTAFGREFLTAEEAKDYLRS